MFYKLFNDKLYEFAKDLSISFPNVPEFKHFKLGVQLGSSLDEKMIEPIFRKNVMKYRDHIMKKDALFFLNSTFEDIAELNKEVQGFGEDHIKQTIIKIKNLWESLDNNNKETIWKYLQVLLILSDKCHSS